MNPIDKTLTQTLLGSDTSNVPTAYKARIVASVVDNDDEDMDFDDDDEVPLGILDDTLLDERSGPVTDVKVKIIRIIFTFASGQSFFMILFGYYIYSLGEIVISFFNYGGEI